MREVIEQVNEWQATLYMNFIDSENAFDYIHRESMWAIMKKYRLPEKIIRMVKIFYEHFKCAVQDQREIYEGFDFKTGVKQGFNMSGFVVLDYYGWGNEKGRWLVLGQVEIHI